MPDIIELSDAHLDLISAGHDDAGHHDDDDCGCNNNPSTVTIATGDITVAPHVGVQILSDGSTLQVN